MYKGNVDLEAFDSCLNQIEHPVVYNGDINSVDDFNRLAEKFPTVSGWMIGRGALANPFLPGDIKKITPGRERRKILASFHEELFQCYQENDHNRVGISYLMF